MFSFLKKDPLKKAEKQYKSKLTEAMNAQRSGDIQGFAKLSQEADEILKGMEVLKNKK
jgi:hypothetical protein